MKLYLMRHAQAASAFDDPDRGLTHEGVTEVKRVLSRLPVMQQPIAHIMHSDTTRTTQTARMVAEHLSIDQVTVAAQWLGESSGIEGCLTDIPHWEQDTLLVSHYPFLNQLINALVINDTSQSPIVQFATAVLVCLEKQETKQWVIRWVLSPNQ